MTSSMKESQIFKVNAFALQDKIKDLGEQCYQLGKIGYVVMEQKIELETLLYKQGSFVSILNAVVEMRFSLTKFNEIVQGCINMLRIYNEILTVYQELNQQQRQISSKISVNKQIFRKCKNDFSQLSRFFSNFEKIQPTLNSLVLL